MTPAIHAWVVRLIVVTKIEPPGWNDKNNLPISEKGFLDSIGFFFIVLIAWCMQINK